MLTIPIRGSLKPSRGPRLGSQMGPPFRVDRNCVGVESNWDGMPQLEAEC